MKNRKDAIKQKLSAIIVEMIDLSMQFDARKACENLEKLWMYK